MNSEQVLQARELLKMMQDEDTQIIIQSYPTTGYRTGYEKADNTTIDWLISHNLIICTDTIDYLNAQFDIEIYKVTELGSLVEMFSVLSDEWDMVEVEGFDAFYMHGKTIYNILQKYNDDEVAPLTKLITAQEQEAYNQYYRQNIQQILKNRVSTTSDDTPNIDATWTWNGILPMFLMSVSLGEKGTDATRTEEYVLRKINEELGEMTLEMNIRDGLSYKEAGSDGVAGEAVDLAICAMDMFALQYPDKTAEEIQTLFITYMVKKLEKWKQTIGL